MIAKCASLGKSAARAAALSRVVPFTESIAVTAKVAFEFLTAVEAGHLKWHLQL